jgi:hypothetical protein
MLNRWLRIRLLHVAHRGMLRMGALQLCSAAATCLPNEPARERCYAGVTDRVRVEHEHAQCARTRECVGEDCTDPTRSRNRV